MPRGKQKREHGQSERGENSHGPQLMPCCRRAAAQEAYRQDRQNEQNSGLNAASEQESKCRFGAAEQGHGWPSFLLFAMRRERRSSSSEEIREISPPRRVATVFSVDPSKNVSTR